MTKIKYFFFNFIIVLFMLTLLGCEKKRVYPSLVEQCVEAEINLLDNDRVTLICVDEYRYDGRVYVELQYEALALGKTISINYLYVLYDTELMSLIAEFPIAKDESSYDEFFTECLVYYQAYKIAKENGEHVYYNKDQFQKMFEEALIRKNEKGEVENGAGTY